MKHPITLICLFAFCSLAAAPVKKLRIDYREFNLSATSATQPTVQLSPDPAKLIHANAAFFYLRAAITDTDKSRNLVYQAGEALNARDTKKFKLLAAQACDCPDVFRLLELAASCDSCDWQYTPAGAGNIPVQEELNEFIAIGNLLSMRIQLQLADGKTDEALHTVSLLLKMGRDLGKGNLAISGLRAAANTDFACHWLGIIMSRPDAPNLYPALNALPSPIPTFAKTYGWDFGQSLELAFPEILTAKQSKFSSDQWRKFMNDLIASNNKDHNRWHVPGPTAPSFDDALNPDGSATAILPRAKTELAKIQNKPLDDISKLDPSTIVASFYFFQYDHIITEINESGHLPYTQLIPKLTSIDEEVAQIKIDAPQNPFLAHLYDLARPASTLAKADRTLSALTVVEAIRSYAAANGGALPERLDELKETPAPNNPWTGRPFEYQVKNDYGEITDPDNASLAPMRYIIRIRQ